MKREYITDVEGLVQKPMRESTKVYATRVLSQLENIQYYYQIVQGFFPEGKEGRFTEEAKEGPAIGYPSQSPQLDSILYKVLKLLNQQTAVNEGILDQVEESLVEEVEEVEAQLHQLAITPIEKLIVSYPRLDPTHHDPSDELKHVSTIISTMTRDFILPIQEALTHLIAHPTQGRCPFNVMAEGILQLTAQALHRWVIQLEDICLYVKKMVNDPEEEDSSMCRVPKEDIPQVIPPEITEKELASWKQQHLNLPYLK